MGLNKNEKLLSENLALKNQLSEIVFLKQQNEEMRKALQLGLEKEFDLLLSKVITSF